MHVRAGQRRDVGHAPADGAPHPLVAVGSLQELVVDPADLAALERRDLLDEHGALLLDRRVVEGARIQECVEPFAEHRGVLFQRAHDEVGFVSLGEGLDRQHPRLGGPDHPVDLGHPRVLAEMGEARFAVRIVISAPADAHAHRDRMQAGRRFPDQRHAVDDRAHAPALRDDGMALRAEAQHVLHEERRADDSGHAATRTRAMAVSCRVSGNPE
ncbi:hypothetical protein WT18_19405 [Burkholderia stagnalis]|nr:hypothetical protein [Burkholderia stagnalis]KVO57056.1 hypothetical protein WT18_19405 [Burkholderia stagnalis]